MCTQSNKDAAASHHDQITGTSLGEHRRTAQRRAFFLSVAAGVKSVWLSQSFCQSSFHFTGQRGDTVGGRRGMAAATNQPLNLSKRAWAFNSIVDIHTQMNTPLQMSVYCRAHTKDFCLFFFINILGVRSARAPGFSTTSKGFVAGLLSLLYRD